MPLVSTQRKYLSDVVKGYNGFNNSQAMEFNFATIMLTDETNDGSAALTIKDLEPIGIPVIWNTLASKWVVYNNDDLLDAATDDSTLPDGSPIAVVVGDEFGLGFNPEDVTVTDAGIPVTVFFRGANNAGVVKNPTEPLTTDDAYPAIDWSANGNFTPTLTNQTTIANINAFYAQLEKQGIMVIDNAEVITPTYTS